MYLTATNKGGKKVGSSTAGEGRGVVLSRSRVQGPPHRRSPPLPPPLTTGAGDGRTCAGPRARLPTAARGARSKVTAHPRPPGQRPSALRGQGQVAGRGQQHPQHQEAPPRDRKMAAAAPGPGPSASPGSKRAPRRRRAREAAGPGARQACPGPERGRAGGGKCWGVGEGTLTGAPAADIPSTPVLHSKSSPPPAAPQSGAAFFLPTFEFEVCGRVEDQDLIVLRHGPRGGRHRRDSAERGRARGGGLLAGTMAGTAQPSSTMGPVLGSRTPGACRCVAGCRAARWFSSSGSHN